MKQAIMPIEVRLTYIGGFMPDRATAKRYYGFMISNGEVTAIKVDWERYNDVPRDDEGLWRLVCATGEANVQMLVLEAQKLGGVVINGNEYSPAPPMRILHGVMLDYASVVSSDVTTHGFRMWTGGDRASSLIVARWGQSKGVPESPDELLAFAWRNRHHPSGRLPGMASDMDAMFAMAAEDGHVTVDGVPIPFDPSSMEKEDA
jgi:hypothetical protein